MIYKAYKNLFEAIGKKSKKTCYSELFAKYKSDMLGKLYMKSLATQKINGKTFLQKLVINNTKVLQK